MPTAVGRFFEQLRDRNRWPRRLWYPPERYTTIDPKSEAWKKESTELQSLIKKTILTTVGFSAFCLLSLAAPDASILDAKSKVKIALLNIDIDYTAFLYVGPMLIIALSLYIHVLLAEWFEKLKPHAKDADSVDIYTMKPDIFNIQVYRFAGIIYNCFFYWMPVFVLICFALKWIPQPRNQLGMVFSTFLSSIAIPVLIWIKIRRCPDSRRLIKNLFSWVVLGMTPLYFSLLCFFPGHLPRDISGMKLYGVDFHRQDLTNVFLPFADLRKANLQDATCRGHLEETYLQGANLQGANLQGANLQGADLQDANLQGADLQDAELQGAYLQATNLRAPNCSAPTCRVPSCRTPSCRTPSCRTPTCRALTCSAPSCRALTCRALTCRALTCRVPTWKRPTCRVPTCRVPSWKRPPCRVPSCRVPSCRSSCRAPTCAERNCVELT